MIQFKNRPRRAKQSGVRDDLQKKNPDYTNEVLIIVSWLNNIVLK